MSPEVLTLVAMFAVGGLVGVQVEKALAKQRRAEWRRRNQGKWDKRGRGGKSLPFQPKPDPLPPKVPDAADQLRTVMRAEFRAQPLLNTGEARVFKELD